jgi:hypothetical protein
MVSSASIVSVWDEPRLCREPERWAILVSLLMTSRGRSECHGCGMLEFLAWPWSRLLVLRALLDEGWAELELGGAAELDLGREERIEEAAEALGPPAREMAMRGVVPFGEASPPAKGFWFLLRRLLREPDGLRLGSLMGSSRMEEKGLEGWKELLEEREGGALLEAIVLCCVGLLLV